jgi:hypothetical protein
MVKRSTEEQMLEKLEGAPTDLLCINISSS